MTEHSTAIKVDVFSDEFMPILTALNFAMRSPDFVERISKKEGQRELLEQFIDVFADLALEHAG